MPVNVDLPPIDIAYTVEMSHEEFSRLPQKGKWYYFYLVHYGPDSDQIKYLLSR